MRISGRVGAWVLVPALLLASPGVSAQDETPAAEPGAPDRPLLLLILTAETDAGTARERRLFSELELTLDGFAIEAVESGDPEFARLPMSEQLSRIQPLVDRFQAVATTWLEETAADKVLLHLVALTTGRALVRIVAAPSGPGAEAELALAVRELLGQAYMFGPAPDDEAMERVVVEVQEKVAPRAPFFAPISEPVPPAPAVDAEPERAAWGVAPLVLVSGGIHGHVGPHTRVGGGVAAEWRPIAELFLRLGLVAGKGPDARVPDGLVVGYSVAPGLELGYGWRLGPVALGPLVSFWAPWTHVSMILGEGDEQSFSFWSIRTAFGLEIRLELTEDLAVFADGKVGFLPLRESFERESGKGTVLATPFVDWDVVIGLTVYIG